MGNIRMPIYGRKRLFKQFLVSKLVKYQYFSMKPLLFDLWAQNTCFERLPSRYLQKCGFEAWKT